MRLGLCFWFGPIHINKLVRIRLCPKYCGMERCALNKERGKASTSFPKLEWEKALELPENEKAPDCLRCHVEDELRILFFH